MDGVSRSEWLANLDWRQGEHIVVVGETGTGKTTLIRDVMPLRDWVVVVAVKRRDDTLDTFKGYTRCKDWPPPLNVRRAILDARPRRLGDRASQAKLVRKMMDHLFFAGGWAADFDDAGFIMHSLGLKDDFVTLLNQGRSLGLSIVSTMTRPSSATAGVPLEAFSQVRHTILFPTGDGGEYRRMAQLARMPEKELTTVMRDLGDHDFIAVSHRERVIVRAA